MSNAHRNRLARVFTLLALAALVSVAAACSGGEDRPQLPSTQRGNTLIVSVKEIRERDVIYYQDADGAIYELRPSDSSRRLVAIRAQVYNERATTAIMNVDEEGYTLQDKVGKDYPSLNPFGPTRRLEPNPPADWDPLDLFIWGNFEMPLGYSIEGWTVFDVPKELKPYRFRWAALETVVAPFFRSG